MSVELYLTFGTLAFAIVFAVTYSLFQRWTVHETQRALLYRHGKFLRLLEPGSHRAFGRGFRIESVDMRTISQVIGNQEITTKDGAPVKVSLIVSFAVSDPYVFKTKFYDAYTELHQSVQVALRDVVLALGIEEFVENRAQIAVQVLERAGANATALGLELKDVRVRDVLLGGGVKAAMADIVRAQFEGRAALERARAEAATMRSLANTARMIEEQPALVRLRLLQAIESGKATVVVGDASLATLGK